MLYLLSAQQTLLEAFWRTFMVQFQVGDNAVYPGHGVGKVVANETKEILGKKQTFYIQIGIMDLLNTFHGIQ